MIALSVWYTTVSQPRTTGKPLSEYGCPDPETFVSLHLLNLLSLGKTFCCCFFQLKIHGLWPHRVSFSRKVPQCKVPGVTNGAVATAKGACHPWGSGLSAGASWAPSGGCRGLPIASSSIGGSATIPGAFWWPGFILESMGEKHGGFFAMAQEIAHGAGSFSATLSVASLPDQYQETVDKFVVSA